MLNNDLQEKIEQYHSGNMSAGDRASFENEIASNPDLRAESDFQADIISGIKEYRKTQLKTRLDAIDVSPGWIEFARQSTLVKSFGGVAVASLIGSAVYFSADKKVENPTTLSIVEVESIGPESVDFSFVWDIPTFTTATKPALSSESKEPVRKPAMQPKETTPEIAGSKPVEPSTQVAEETFSPNFHAPEAGEVNEEKEPVGSSLDEVPIVVGDTKNEDPIEVETKNSKSAKIRYKYYDGKLFLSGNFNKELYEILEINSAKGRRIYLLHQSKYFEVKTTDRLTELPEVTNVKLIQELRLIKENK